MTESIVLRICQEHHVKPAEFFGKERNRKVIAARRAAIEAFISAGFSMAGTARMMRRDISTIRYWLKPHRRERVLRRMMRHTQMKRNPNWQNAIQRGMVTT